MSPKKASKGNPAPDDQPWCEEIAAELGVTVNYKTLRASSENLSKTEEKLCLKAQEDALAAAGEEDDDPQAYEKGQLAYKMQAFRCKLQRAWTKHQRKQQEKKPEDETPPIMVPHQVPEVKDHGKRLIYLDLLQSAYNRVLGHRIFKDVCTLEPNPIRVEDAGDCGMQATLLNLFKHKNVFLSSCVSNMFPHRFMSRRLMMTRSVPLLLEGRSFTAQAATSSG